VIGASVSTRELTYGSSLTVTDSVTGATAGVGATPVALRADGYPFRGFLTVARTVTSSDGSFAFAGVRLNRDTRLRVTEEGAQHATSPQLGVVVDPDVASNARSLGPGRTRLSVRVQHVTLGRSARAVARWFVTARGSRYFHLAAVTQTRELSPGLAYASAIVDPPSERFIYRICFNPTWERAMGPAAAHRPCPDQDFKAPRGVG
jgi:hypothetical protein